VLSRRLPKESSPKRICSQKPRWERSRQLQPIPLGKVVCAQHTRCFPASSGQQKMGYLPMREPARCAREQIENWNRRQAYISWLPGRTAAGILVRAQALARSEYTERHFARRNVVSPICGGGGASGSPFLVLVRKKWTSRRPSAIPRSATHHRGARSGARRRSSALALDR